MMKILQISAGAIVGLVALTLAFNFGVDYGSDVGICTTVLYAYDEKPEDVSFCQNVKDKPLHENLRKIYLYSLGELD